MATCSANTLLSQGTGFQACSKRDLQIIIAQLLCNISNSGTGADVSWYVYLPTASYIDPPTISGFGSFSNGRFGGQNDFISYDVSLSAGTWRVDAALQQGNNQGILSVKLDGTIVGTMDAYHASATTPKTFSTATFSVATAGKHTIRFEILSKNGASSGFFVKFYTDASADGGAQLVRTV